MMIFLTSVIFSDFSVYSGPLMFMLHIFRSCSNSCFDLGTIAVFLAASWGFSVPFAASVAVALEPSVDSVGGSVAVVEVAELALEAAEIAWASVAAGFAMIVGVVLMEEAPKILSCSPEGVSDLLSPSSAPGFPPSAFLFPLKKLSFPQPPLLSSSSLLPSFLHLSVQFSPTLVGGIFLLVRTFALLDTPLSLLGICRQVYDATPDHRGMCNQSPLFCQIPRR